MTFICNGCCLALEAKGFGLLGGQGSFLVYKKKGFLWLRVLVLSVRFCLILSEYWMLGDRVKHSFNLPLLTIQQPFYLRRHMPWESQSTSEEGEFVFRKL